MRWTIPNILTVLRLLAAPGVALAFVVFPRPAADWVAIALFILAALTDYIDGRLARAWKQESNFGRMLDPIADKAMVVIALAVIVGISGIKGLILVPVAFILLREVFVSGLREFLGSRAGRLKVTNLAKWKTTAQMVAIPVLLLAGVFEYDRRHGQYWYSHWLHNWLGWLLENGGLLLIWVAGLLTLMTGIDYLMKALPFLRDRKR
ncbi:CDP-diacylglycerol--glycerol-3-phosphate 3-phosphatidyltransferase [Amaricoccus solimangrovi]|uniref:CDP-diacylglycerol--glycerol-3-phosphate 3-phosphatidyltransferase n=1 Tax=Amaricoccus solimangrovi TaxID=2589815 RepID=A0A501WT17_9RHOB|nr:CDP-diacylglycerol--glycerol-3-phosphate 3-phosphatidyltransferase [Amaricoccus solimangrovi]TPE50427.1 CDP-diacylglycerol--glycerol-3-phosphate 3-phosphatidyltransferase [Amaricoccus solimangrovi]